MKESVMSKAPKADKARDEGENGRNDVYAKVSDRVAAASDRTR